MAASRPLFGWGRRDLDTTRDDARINTPDIASEQPRTPQAPPTAPTALPPAPPVWPTVVGIVMIVFGGLGLLFNLWGTIQNLFLNAFIAKMSAQNNPDVAAVIVAWSTPMGLASLLQLSISSLLLASGIGMVMRRPWSIPAARLWAWAKIASTIVTAVLTVLMQREQFAAMTQQMQGQGPGTPAGFFTGILVFTAAFTIAWGWALPIFVLIWLRRQSSRREIATWSAPISGAGDRGVA